MKLGPVSPISGPSVRFLASLARDYRTLQITFLLVSLVQILLNAAVPILIDLLINSVGTPTAIILWYIVETLVVLVVFRILSFAAQYVIGVAQLRLAISLQESLLRRELVGNGSSRLGLTRGDVLSRIMSDAPVVASTAVTWNLTLYSLIVSAGVSTIVLAYLSPVLATATLLAVPLFYLVVAAAAPMVISASQGERVAFSRTTEALRVGIDNEVAIRGIAAVDFAVTGFRLALATWFERARRLTVLSMWTSNSSGFLFGALPLGLFVFGLYLAGTGHGTVGTAVAFLVYVPTLYGSITGITSLYTSINSVAPKIDRVKAILDLPEGSGRTVPLKNVMPILCRDLTVSGPGRAILVHLNLVLDGRIILLTGPNGSGKSTFLRAISGLEDSYEGEILVGGKNLRSIPATELHPRVIYLQGDDIWMDGSLSYNLSLGRTVSTETIIHALNGLGLGVLSNRLSEQAPILTGHMSSGERQRLSLARAFLLNPEVLIIDEALSAVDGPSEAAIAQELSKWGIPHIIVVSQRPEMRSIADRHIEFRSGQIRELPLI
jgi:ABC-type bacteriocin/lantibiotic exporter with double-glycine peptidase domain